MTRTKTQLARVLVVMIVGAIVGCSSGDTVTVNSDGKGTITVSVIPASGTGTSTPTGATSAPAQPGTGNTDTPTAEPTVPATTPAATVPAAPTNPAAATTTPSGTGATKRANIESEYGIKVTGKDANKDECLDTLAYALSRFPKGTHKGLTVSIDIQSLDVTGGVGGYWTQDGPYLKVYQCTMDWCHVIIHELAHHHDLWTNREQITSACLAAGKENGSYPTENIPSPYGKYGLTHSGYEPEYEAECFSWSLDTRAKTGFKPYQSWKPRQKLIDVMNKYLERDKVIWNQGS